MQTQLGWRTWFARAGATLAALLVCSIASAQSGAIAGIVKDSSGGVLPGVTVEVSSPSLIEKVRSAASDDSGQFKIVNLPIGTYSITFTLPGFSTVNQAGITLTSNFTASINAELKPGALEETITVSGAAPVVDVQNVAVQKVMSREVMDDLPTGKFFGNYGVLVPGTVGSTNDVGGTTTNNKQNLAIHGGRDLDQMPLMNGMSFGSTHINQSSYSFLIVPDSDIQETNITTSSAPAEIENGGMIYNLVPKIGGNQFHGSAFYSFGNKSTQADNVTPELKAQGIPSNVGVKTNHYFDPAIGGPIKQDKLWFFTSYEQTYRKNYLNAFERVNNQAPITTREGQMYIPDLTKQAVGGHTGFGALSGRLTYQMSSRMKLTGGYLYNQWCECRAGSATGSPETSYKADSPEDLAQIVWTMPATNKLLYEAGYSVYRVHFDRGQQADASGPRIVDLNGIGINAVATSPTTIGEYSDIYSNNITFRASFSYVTGTHAFKFGGNYTPQHENIYTHAAGDTNVCKPSGSSFTCTGNPIEYEIAENTSLTVPTPRTVTYLPLPAYIEDWVHRTGLYAQDQWTMNRLALNYGVRFDWFTGGWPANEAHPVLFKEAHPFPAEQAVNWKDLSPRLGAAYDLFGNGKTALKVGLSRFVTQYSLDLMKPTNPAGALAGSSIRNWTDTGCVGATNCVTGDWIPQGDPLNPAANGELGAASNATFGSYRSTLLFDQDWTKGYGQRPYNWETTVGIDHQLVPNVSVSAAYFRRWYGNHLVKYNSRVQPSDYQRYCITVPNNASPYADGNPPNAGGQLCGFYDLIPSVFAAVGNTYDHETSASRFGGEGENWNGVDLTTNIRLAALTLQGGLSTGKSMNDTCEIFKQQGGRVFAPPPLIGTSLNTLGAISSIPDDNCHLETPWLTQVKMIGTYRLPWQDIGISATVQDSPGGAYNANYAVPNASISGLTTPGTGAARNPNAALSANLLPPGSAYNDRIAQVDLKFTKTIRMADQRNFRAAVGIYNAFNSNALTGVSSTFNAANWQKATSILSARFVKFEGQYSF